MTPSPRICPACGSTDIRFREKRGHWFCDACDHRWTVNSARSSATGDLPSIFLSYARGDDEPFVRRLCDDLTARGFDVWFDREGMESRGVTFHQQIRDAIAARDRMLLVVGPKAAASVYVQQEWQFAWFEKGMVVTPILRIGDYPLAIEELAVLHCEDFRIDAEYADHLKNLLRQLSAPAPALGELIGVPSLPAHYLSRRDRLVPLRDAVRSGLDNPAPFGGTVARQQFHGIAGLSKHVGMHGMGGIGKSILANLVGRDREVRKAFPDGILWVGLGSTPELRQRMADVHRSLGGEGDIATEAEGKQKLKRLFQDKALLLILDDAWRLSDVEAFDVLGPRCRALITTRDAGLLNSLGGSHHMVELLTDDEALRLLAVAARRPFEDLTREARLVLSECGRLPLAVALAGGMVSAGTPWIDVYEALLKHELEFISDKHRREEHQDLWKMIEVSVRALPEQDQLRLVELAVYPEDEWIPDASAATLWKSTGNRRAQDSRLLLVELKQRSLIQLMPSENPASASVGSVSLHDLIHDYCLRRAVREFGNTKILHDKLLAAYREQCPDGWPSGPNDEYFFKQLCWHLAEAGRTGELAALLQDLTWLEAKNGHGLAFDLPFDFGIALRALSDEEEPRRILKLIEEGLRREIHFIARHAEDYPQGLFQCLWNSGWWPAWPEAAKHYVEPEGGWPELPPWALDGAKLSDLLEGWKQEKAVNTPGLVWLRMLRPPAVHLGTAQRAVLRGHGDFVNSVSFSPDGRRIASGSNDSTARVWDAESGEELRVLCGHRGSVHSVSFSPDGRRIVTGGGHTVRVWDAESGEALCVIRGHNGVVAGALFSPNGRRIVSGSWDNTVRVWDAESGEELRVLRGHESNVTSVSISPDGRRIASGSWDNTVRVWDAESGEELRVLRGHKAIVFSVLFSPDGRRIISGSGDCTMREWDAESGESLRALRGHQGYVNSVSFSADGRRIISGSTDKTAREWDVESGETLHVVHGHENWVTSVSFSPDGRRIVSGSSDKTVRVWDAESSEELRVLRGHDHDVNSVSLSSDGRRVASGADDSTVRVWNMGTGEELRVLSGHKNQVNCVSFSPDGRWIASGSGCEWGSDNTVRVWDADSGNQLCVLRGHQGDVNCVSFSPDGRRIASGSDDYTARIWDAESGEELRVLRGHDGDVNCVSFSPDGRRIASGSGRFRDSTVRVWDVESGEELRVFRGHEESVNSVSFSPDGRRIASGAGDNTVWIWDTESRLNRRRSFIFGSGSDEMTARAAESGEEHRVLRGHEHGVNRVSFSPDGRRIVSISRWDNTVRVWDAESGECLEVIEGNGDADAIAAGPSSFPFRALSRGLETVVEDAFTGRPIAFFPSALARICTHPAGRMWAGADASYLCLLELEGDVERPTGDELLIIPVAPQPGMHAQIRTKPVRLTETVPKTDRATAPKSPEQK